MFKKIAYKKAVYMTYLMEWIAGRISKNNKSWFDKNILGVVAKKILSTQKNNIDFMKDELIDSEPEFDVSELEAYEKGQ